MWDLPIVQRWRRILENDWTAIPNTPSPLALDRATLQHFITSELARQRAPTKESLGLPQTKITLHFPPPDANGRINGKQTSNGKDTQHWSPDGVVTPAARTRASVSFSRGTHLAALYISGDPPMWKNS